jgi:hypothetical protein
MVFIYVSMFVCVRYRKSRDYINALICLFMQLLASQKVLKPDAQVFISVATHYCKLGHSRHALAVLGDLTKYAAAANNNNSSSGASGQAPSSSSGSGTGRAQGYPSIREAAFSKGGNTGLGPGEPTASVCNPLLGVALFMSDAPLLRVLLNWYRNDFGVALSHGQLCRAMVVAASEGDATLGVTAFQVGWTVVRLFCCFFFCLFVCLLSRM